MNRRQFLATGGALVVSFSLRAQPKLPGSLAREPLLDSWIRIGADGGITVFTGKAELGQGIKTALIQVAAEELAVEPARIELVTADTARTPDEGYTAGSQSMSESGTAILNAAAEVRAKLVELAAKRFALPPERLSVANGAIRAGDGRSASYGELVTGELLHVKAQPPAARGNPRERAVIGKSLARVDIPAKLTGAPIYVQDLRLPGMVHARTVRPPSHAARLAALRTAAVEKMPGVLKIVRDGSYLAVVAEREYQAVSAMRALAAAARWNKQQENLHSDLQRLPSQLSVLVESEAAAPAWSAEATYRRPYQMHGSIGPSCAVGLYRDGNLTVWTHSQGVYPLRNALAEMLGLPKKRVRCIHMEGSGCYGHNAADDAGADAALAARALPGRPVRVHLMREDEHAWEPYGSAMLTRARARLEGGKIADWHYELWSGSHSSRPGPAGNLAPAWLLEKPFARPPAQQIPQPTGGGDRNAIPLYRFASTRVVHHFLTAMPLRVSALRSLGAYMNVFSIESFMDELAQAARADPVEFRLRHLDDPRAREVIRTAAERFGWAGYRKQRGRGRGFAFARYKNLAAYCAIACEVEVERTSGQVRMLRASAAIDSGEAVNPDGIRNQVEGGILQSLSWTLHEAVSFDASRITSRDWASYPILRFPDVPERIDVEVISRPGAPFLGTGEAAQGPAAAALANAIADATGARLREIPFTAPRVRQALGA
ncbi:MAG: xanthine dehydrogenase family protein molybdopterin-binding subunit [Betaproteobacteria bacterium]|nr:MAG: xanthine dehydrogenase family protein molybdopterin-binding subunit [Betaproteobacteria bacterium]